MSGLRRALAAEDRYTRTREASSSVRRALTYRRCRIAVTEGPDRAPRLESEKDIIRVGAQGDNDLVIADPAISRHHLEVHKRDGEYAIVDRDSTNGTFVGALRVKEAIIRRRGEIQIGDSTLLFEPLETELVVEPSSAQRCVDLVGRSVGMREAYTIIDRVAPTELTVLVTGHPGADIELVARALHAKSRRSNGPFERVQCGTLPEERVDSELFGLAAGSDTDDGQTSAGAFERAHGGTLFLDGIDALPPSTQPAVLRALERGEVWAPGKKEPARFDVRVVAGTHRDLYAMVDDGKFRGDLFYRLAVIPISLPPLDQRPEDIPLIIDDFFERHGPRLWETGVRARGVGPGALDVLYRYRYGLADVRELTNILRQASVVAAGEEITIADLPKRLVEKASAAPPTDEGGTVPVPDTSTPFKDAKAAVLDTFERRYLQDLLRRHDYNRSKASRESGIDRRHLYRLLDKYGIDVRGRGDE